MSWLLAFFLLLVISSLFLTIREHVDLLPLRFPSLPSFSTEEDPEQTAGKGSGKGKGKGKGKEKETTADIKALSPKEEWARLQKWVRAGDETWARASPGTRKTLAYLWLSCAQRYLRGHKASGTPANPAMAEEYARASARTGACCSAKILLGQMALEGKGKRVTEPLPEKALEHFLDAYETDFLGEGRLEGLQGLLLLGEMFHFGVHPHLEEDLYLANAIYDKCHEILRAYEGTPWHSPRSFLGRLAPQVATRRQEIEQDRLSVAFFQPQPEGLGLRVLAVLERPPVYPSSTELSEAEPGWEARADLLQGQDYLLQGEGNLSGDGGPVRVREATRKAPKDEVTSLYLREVDRRGLKASVSTEPVPEIVNYELVDDAFLTDLMGLFEGNYGWGQSQNVHDHHVQSQTAQRVQQLEAEVLQKNGGAMVTFAQASEWWKKAAPQLCPEWYHAHGRDALKALESLTDNRHSRYDKSEKEIFCLQVEHVRNLPSEQLANCVEALGRALADSVEYGRVVCSTGKCVRLMDCLQGIDLEQKALVPESEIKAELARLVAKLREKTLAEAPEDIRTAYNEGQDEEDCPELASFVRKLKEKIERTAVETYVSSDVIQESTLKKHLSPLLEAL